MLLVQFFVDILPYYVYHFSVWEFVKDAIAAHDDEVVLSSYEFELFDFWLCWDHIGDASELPHLSFDVSESPRDRESAREHSHGAELVLLGLLVQQTAVV